MNDRARANVIGTKDKGATLAYMPLFETETFFILRTVGAIVTTAPYYYEHCMSEIELKTP